MHQNLSDFCHYIRFYRICRRKPHKRISFFPYHSPRCGVNLFRFRYCSQELVCEAIVVTRTLSNYVEAILWGATETKKSLRVNLCRKLLRHSTRKDSVSDRKANTTGLLHLVAVIAIGKGSAFSLLKVSARNDMYNCFWASSFCVRDIFLQTLHYAFIDTHDKISFEIFDIGLFGECEKIFFAGEGSIICFAIPALESP